MMKFDRPKTVKYTAHSTSRATVVSVVVFLGLDSQKMGYPRCKLQGATQKFLDNCYKT
jgi:hypothetical protein